ncbi:MAG: hypothetical protein AB9856_15125 [Cellulosilyticaceae bacterium]
MQKKRKIWLGVLGLVVVAVCSVGIWQRNNVQALVTAGTMDQDEIVTKIEVNKKQVEKAMKDYNITPVRDLSFEEEERIRKGEITPQQAISNILKEQKAEEKEKKVDTSDDLQKIVQDAVSKMYGLKAQYVGKLGSVEQRAKSDYLSLPKAQRGMKGKQKIISKYVSYAMGLEGSCDGQVEAVLSELEVKLQKSGGDTSIVRTMRSAYKNEKSLKKAYYMSLLTN